MSIPRHPRIIPLGFLCCIVPQSGRERLYHKQSLCARSLASAGLIAEAYRWRKAEQPIEKGMQQTMPPLRAMSDSSSQCSRREFRAQSIEGHLTRAFVLTVSISMLLAGCGLAARREQAAQVAAIRESVKTATESCQQQYSELPKDAIARANCFNDADRTLKQVVRYPDLIELRIAKRSEVAERIASGKITRAQGVLELSQLQTSLVDQEQKRMLANRSVQAQETAAAAAVAASSPTTCTQYGNSVTCF